MTEQEQFFYDRAVYGYDPKVETPEQGRVRGAVRLAQAETYARNNFWRYGWELDDIQIWDGDGPKPRGQAYVCVLFDASAMGKRNVLGSLGGIWGATKAYCRVVEAELALDAMKPEDFPDYVPAGDIPMATA